MSERLGRITKIKALWLPGIQDENSGYMSVDIDDAIWIVGEVDRLSAKLSRFSELQYKRLDEAKTEIDRLKAILSFKRSASGDVQVGVRLPNPQGATPC